jgi:hypothetical protein
MPLSIGSTTSFFEENLKVLSSEAVLLPYVHSRWMGVECVGCMYDVVLFRIINRV